MTEPLAATREVGLGRVTVASRGTDTTDTTDTTETGGGPTGRRRRSPVPRRDRWTNGPVVGLGCLFVGCATLLQLVRSTGVPSWDSLWQEDGGIFLTDALHRHLANALTRPYNGYLHVVPRLLAALAVHLPLRDAGWVFAVSSALVASLVAVYVWWASRLLIAAAWARALLAVLVCLAPVSAYETDNNINNLHWYLLFALAFVPFSRPRTRWGVSLNLAVVVVAVLSDSEALLLVPLFLPAAWRGLRQRQLGQLLVPAAVAVCLVVQLAVGAAGKQPGRYTSSHWSDLPEIYAFRVAASFLLGDRYLPRLYDAHGLAFAYLCLTVLVLLLIGAALVSRASRPLLAVTALGSALFLGVPLMLRGTENFLTRPGATLNGSRYALLPVLFLATGLLSAAARLAPRLTDTGGRARTAPSIVLLLTLSIVGYNYADFNVRGPGPSWRAELARAAATCRQTADQPREHTTSADNPYGTTTTPGDVSVPVSPSLPQEVPFAVVIDCRELRRDLGSQSP